jgi:hypothetical protein
MDIDVVDSLALCECLGIKGTDIGNVLLQVHQVNVAVLINYYQSFGLLTPGDIGYIGIAECVDLIVGSDAMIVEMIAVETIRGSHKEGVTACLDNLLGLVIRHEGPPGAYLSN